MVEELVEMALQEAKHIAKKTVEDLADEIFKCVLENVLNGDDCDKDIKSFSQANQHRLTEIRQVTKELAGELN